MRRLRPTKGHRSDIRGERQGRMYPGFWIAIHSDEKGYMGENRTQLEPGYSLDRGSRKLVEKFDFRCDPQRYNDDRRVGVVGICSYCGGSSL